MDKKHLVNIIQEICKKEGWSYHLNYKGKEWKADIVIEQPSSKFAINICKCPRNIETKYKIMLEDNTFGCWLLLPVDRYVDFNRNTPCFMLSETNEQIEVTLYSTYYYDKGVSIEIKDFIDSLIKGKIKKANKMIVKYAEVIFINYTCWKCRSYNHVYYIKSLQSKEGVIITDVEDDKIKFNPQLIEAIKSHIENNKEKNIRLGEIKQRYSKSMDESYTSFGCINCNNIFGKIFVDDIISEDYYTPNSSYIEMGNNDFEIEANCWYKEK